ncbi:hypothetical protein FMUBM48_48950 [Nocardia cyriacigeorgica]|nr:hypothetical protein FMUBM48_48950 [Nocardia cyriacigeorgica]
MIRIDRHIRATGLQHRVHADDQLQRAAHTQRDQRFRADTVGDQEPGQPVDPLVEFGVGEGGALEIERDVVRGARDLRVQQRGQRGGRHLVRRIVPLHQRFGAFGGGGDLELPDRSVGVGGQEAVEELQEPAVMAAGLVLGVEVRVGLEVDMRAGARHRLIEVDAQILDAAGGQHAELTDHRAEHQLVVEQHDVDPRTEELRGHHTVAGGVTADVLVPVALMTQCTRHLDLHLPQQFGDRSVIADMQAQRHDIGGHTAGTAHRGGRASGDRQAEDDLFVARQLRQVRGETGDQHRSGRGIVARDGIAEQRILLLRQRRADDPVHRRRRRRPSGQARPLLQARHPLRPVLLIGLEARAVAVGDLGFVERAQVGRLARRGLGAGDVGGVELGDARHERHRAEAVEGDVMRPRVPEPAVILDAQRGGADQAVLDDVERLRVLRAHPLLGRGLRILGVAQVDVFEGGVQRRVDGLQRLTIAFDDPQEARPHLQGGVGAGPLEGRYIEVAAQIHILRDVDRHLRIDMLGIPDTQLRRGQRKELIPLTTSFAVSAEIQPVQP